MNTKVELLPCPFCATAEHLSVSPCGSMTADMPARPHRVVCFHIDHDEVAGPVGYGSLEAITAWNTRPQVPQGIGRDELVEAVAQAIGALDWINTQAESAMAISAGCSLTHGDDGGALEMLNSTASDIGINATMQRDNLSTILSRMESGEKG